MKFGILYKLILALMPIGMAAILLSSCIKKPNYPSEPVIEYKDFLRYGNPSDPDSAKLILSFTDNEGDVGLEQSDMQGILNNGNLFLIFYYYNSSGTWVPDTLFDLKFGVPPVLPQGDPDEPIKGTIYVKISSPFGASYKKIKFEIYMYDKALHKSNTIETPPILF